MEAILYRFDGTKSKMKISSFTEARGIVCNYDANAIAQIVNLNDGSLFLIDDEGKLKNYPINKFATDIAQLNEAIYPHDYIVGDVLFFNNENEFEDLSYE